MVGVSGFEPEASWTRTKRDTKLRHTPISLVIISKLYRIVKTFLLLSSAFCFYSLRNIKRGDQMGYRIDYCKSGNKKLIRQNVNKSNKFVSGALIAIAFCVSAFILQGNGKSMEKIFIPGDPVETKAAFSAFTHHLENGKSFRESLMEFCREIIEYAGE